MDLDRLRLFLQVVEAGTLSAATRTAHLTQPAISRSLKLLEQELGVALFDRVGRGLVLSAAGRALVPRARTLLDASGRSAREVQRAAQRAYYDLRLGTIDSVATSLLPQVVAPLRARFPELVVKLTTGRTSHLVAQVGSGDLDLAIVAHSGPPLGLAHRRLGRYALEYYGRKDRFAALARCRTEAELRRFPVVEIDPGAGSSSIEPGEELSYARASNVATVKALVLAGFGVGDLPTFMLDARERKQVCHSAVPHDPHCGLFLVRAASWGGEVELAVEAALGKLVSARLRP